MTDRRVVSNTKITFDATEVTMGSFLFKGTYNWLKKKPPVKYRVIFGLNLVIIIL